MYDRTIPVFTSSLNAMSAILQKAEAHCTEKRIDPAVLLGYRLFPDMLNFTRQIQIASDHARRCPARVTGVEPLSMPDIETTFGQLRDRISRTVEHIATFVPVVFEGSAERTVSFKAGGRDVTLSGSDYVGRYALPNFFFHLTTAYNILRHNGVVLGKTDFLGA
jgi:hypothetical protein